MMTIPKRREVMRQARERGQKIAAVLPIHYPRPLLRAFGYHPVEIWGPPEVDPAEGNAHFQSYTCAIVRNATSLLCSDAARDVDLIMIPHTCDALQGMGSVFKDFLQPPQPVLTLYHPRGRRESDLAFLVAELKQLAASLEAITGTPLALEALEQELAREEEVLEAYARLSRHRADYGCSDREFYTLLRAWEYLPPESFLALAKEVPRKPQPEGPVKLLLSGIVPEPMAIFDHINEAGAQVVADDLACCSRRIYTRQTEGDPWQRLARMLMSMPPDPTVGNPINDRIAFLTERMEETGAQGILVYDVKFCEPELFDLPLLRKGLARAGKPMLHIEFEMGAPLSGQALTRIEAFVETFQ